MSFYFNPSASPVVFNPLLFSRGVIFTFFATVFSMRLASNAIFLSVQVISWKVKSTRRYLFALSHIEEVVTIHLDVLDGDVVALAQWHVLAVAWLEELGPWTDDEETAGGALDVIHCYVLVMLRSIRAHFQPEHALCIVYLDVAEHDVAVFHALAAKG